MSSSKFKKFVPTIRRWIFQTHENRLAFQTQGMEGPDLEI